MERKKYMLKNADKKTVEGFGDQWQRFDQSTPNDDENLFLFKRYFSLVDFNDLPEKAQVFDMGCGSGRWARIVAPHVGRIICVDASAQALQVAQKNLAHLPNAEFLNESAGECSIPPKSMDFGYSLGVLHHLPDTQDAIKQCVQKLKPGAPLLLYLYYALDNKPLQYRALWKMSEGLRIVTSSSPRFLKNAICEFTALTVYWPLARLSWLCEKFEGNVKNFPLSDYRHATFYRMRHNARDRLGTPLEKRFTKDEIRGMMQNAGLKDIVFRDGPPYWCALGIKN